MSVEIEGCVEEIVYRNDENGYTVFELATKGNDIEVTCVGSFSYISEGEYLKMECQETHHPTYGLQYRVITSETVEPEDAEAMRKYLGSGAIKGVGEKMAAKIVEKFKDETFRVIEEEPERLTAIKGISERIAMEISSRFYEKREQRTSMMFLQKYGISGALAVKIYKKYGNGLYEVLRKNPYRMAEEIRGVGFKTADDIARRNEIPIDIQFRIRAGILYVLSEAVGQGHTFLPEDRLKQETAALLGVSEDDLGIQLDKLMLERKIVYDTVGDVAKAVYPAPFYYMELNTSRMLLDLACTMNADREKVVKKLETIERKLDVELDELQRKAVISAVTNGVFVLTGGPGTGKTTTINAIIHFFESEGMDILMAAPTGRAAKRIAETTGREAFTIHRLLQVKVGTDGMDREENDNTFRERVMFDRNESNPLEADVIIIDEMSMVDVSLMCSLLKAIAPGTRLILVGDVNQLPPVGAGNVLKDVIASGLFKTACLTTIFRQATESDIVKNAHKINSGRSIVMDNKSRDFFFIKRDNPNDVAGVVVTLVRDKLPGYVHATSADIQVLTPTRKGELGVERMNSILQMYLNPVSDKKKEKEYNGIVFREGDRVMQTKNNYQLEWENRNKKGFVLSSGSGIYNGDCGVIRRINTYASEMEIEFDEDKLVHYPFSGLDELELAYCVTVHKSQGSEYPAVVLPLLSGPVQLFTRNLLYTAVTRAKSCVTIVGSSEAVDRMIANMHEQKRYSGLEKQLRTMRGETDSRK